MTQSPSIRATVALPPANPGLSATAPSGQDSDTSVEQGRTQNAVAIALTQDHVEILWQAKHDIDSDILRSKQTRDGLNEGEVQRIQRQVAALALSSSPTLSGRETVARQIEALRSGLNPQDVAVLTRKTAIALEANAMSLTSATRETTLRRVF